MLIDEKKTIAEASERWKKEGKIFKDNINAWLDVMYVDKSEPSTPEPLETRKDMAAYVLKQVKAFNDKKEYTKLRELFPPDNDPLIDKLSDVAKYVTKVLLLPDKRILAKTGKPHEEQRSYIINDNSVTEIEELVSFGSSFDKKYIAKAYNNRLEITEGWDGKTISVLNYPHDYGDEFKKRFPEVKINSDLFTGLGLQIESIHVFNNGKRALLCTHGGIFLLSEDDSQLFHPDVESLSEEIEDADRNKDENFSIFLHYPNADLSQDGKYISLGSQMSSHIIFKEDQGKFIKTANIEPRSEYPHKTRFNHLIDVDDKPYAQVALSSCHFSRSATIALPIDNITEKLSASGQDGDAVLDYIDDNSWVFSILPGSFGYYLGTNIGYIWLMGCAGVETLGYIYIGGTVMDMDISEDRNTLVVASHLGQVIVLEWGLEDDAEFSWDKNNRKDPYLITNVSWIDKKRYIFLKGKNPMVW